MAESNLPSVVAAEFVSQLSDLFHQVAQLQCRISSLERTLPDADNQAACSLPSRNEVKPSARVVQKLEEVTFYRPAEALEISTAFGFDLPEPNMTSQMLGPQGDTSGLGPGILHWDEFVPLGEGSIGTALPESILNYCLARLAVSKRPWRDPALGYLLVLVISQQLLMGTFLITSDIKANAYGKGPQHMSLTECALADAWKLSGHSVTKIAAACVSLFLVASMLKTKDAEHLELIYYLKRELGWGLRSFLIWVFFLQVVYLPAMFCIEASILFAASADATEIIMNGLAVVYIMQVDTTFYWSLLDPEERAAYQRESANLNRTCTTQGHVALYARFLFTANIGYMVANYAYSFIGFSFLQHMPNSLVTDVFVFIWMILHGIRSVANFSMMQTSMHNEWPTTCCQCFRHVCIVFLILALSIAISNFWSQFIMGILTGNVTYDYLFLQKVPGCIERAQQAMAYRHALQRLPLGSL